MAAPAANAANIPPLADWFDQLATGVALLDADAVFMRANSAFCELTGFGLRRLIGQPASVLGTEAATIESFARRATGTSGGARLAAIEVCAQPGAERKLDFSLTPCPEGVLLEAHPAPPAAGDARVSESLRGFAHEIRNPLAAISGAAQLLQARADDARQCELAQLVRDESARLAALTERLLGARNAMATRAVNVHAMLERVAALLQAEHAPVTVRRDYDPSLPAWHGDPDRLLQALLNLARNAVEANARRIVLRSRAETGWRDARGQRVPALRIEVEDDGDGVPPGIETTLFEPLVSGRAGGTGLGLALAREIAHEHGGELTWRRCAPGSRFVLLLPRHPRTGSSGVESA